MALLYSNITASSVLNPDTDSQDLHVYENNTNNYDNVFVLSIVKIVTASGGASTAQVVTFTVTIGASTKNYTYTTKTTAEEDFIYLLHAAPARDAASVVKTSFTAPADDANTDVTSMSLFVFGENSR